jgi:hypothetical protein
MQFYQATVDSSRGRDFSVPAVPVRVSVRPSLAAMHARCSTGIGKRNITKWIVGKNEAACAADAAREVVERWLPNG